MRLNIDMTFELTQPAGPGEEPTTLHGTITADGTEVTVHSDHADLFRVDRSPAVAAAKGVAAGLAEKGLVLNLEGPHGTIVSLGAVKASPMQRLLTRSRYIKAGSLKALAPFRSGRVPQSMNLLPPATPFPLLPMLQRNIRRKVTTTHYTSGGGRPRLLLVRDSEQWDGSMPTEFDLTEDVTRIGSNSTSQLRLEGLDDLHAEIRHTETDEYVLIGHGRIGGSSNAPAGEEVVLRTGARLVMGPWRLGFFREEYADHGRPHGGRGGGELSYQKSQYNPYTKTLDVDSSVSTGDNRNDNPQP